MAVLEWLSFNIHTSKLLSRKLVSIELENSNIKLVWKEPQKMTVNGIGGCLLPGDSYPDWLTFNCEGSSVIFEVPQVEGHNLKTMMCIVHSSSPNNITTDGLKNVLVINHTKTTIQLYKREALASFENEEGQRVVSSIEPGNKVEVVIALEQGFTVKNTSVYLVYDEPIVEEKEQCHATDRNVTVCSGDANDCDVRRNHLMKFAVCGLTLLFGALATKKVWRKVRHI